MIRDLDGGYCMMTGSLCKDAGDVRTVGARNTLRATRGILVGGKGKNEPDVRTLYGWREYAPMLADAPKAARVFVIARMSSRDYKGKTYIDYNIEFMAFGPDRLEDDPSVAPNALEAGAEPVADDDLPF